MNIKNIVIAAVILVMGAAAYILTKIPEKTPLDEPVSEAVRKIEVPHRPVLEKEQKKEVVREKSVPDTPPDMPRGDIKADTEEKTIELEKWGETGADKERDKGITAEEGPPSEKEGKPLPIFESVTNDTGPAAQREDDIQTADNPELPELIDEYSYDGPPVPPDVETKPLPPFTPITNKTGPVSINKNK